MKSEAGIKFKKSQYPGEKKKKRNRENEYNPETQTRDLSRANSLATKLHIIPISAELCLLQGSNPLRMSLGYEQSVAILWSSKSL